MTISQIKKIIEQNKHDIAFVIGNGINRYKASNSSLSWDDILMKLWDKVSGNTLSFRPEGISTTEFYDILEFENTTINESVDLQQHVADLMRKWEPKDHHKLIVDAIRQLNAPLLTTNYEETLAKTMDYKLLRTENKGFTDYYPWSVYHGDKQISHPSDGFAIWYINGMIEYKRSIRLGLTHYLNSVKRVNTWIHKDENKNDFIGKNQNNWIGSKSWLHLFFNKSLFFFGLGLEENETFLRWLLIERKRYFRKYSNRRHKSWYLQKKCDSENDSGKKFFLEKVGFEIIEVDDYDEIYDQIWR